MTDCLFCLIVAGAIPAEVIAEDDRTITFMDISPATRGHALVIPREHARDLYDISVLDLEACSTAAKRTALLARDRLGADGVNLLNSCQPQAWQTVFHFHIHVIPRYESDSLQLPWVPALGSADEISQSARALRGS